MSAIGNHEILNESGGEMFGQTRGFRKTSTLTVPNTTPVDTGVSNSAGPVTETRLFPAGLWEFLPSLFLFVLIVAPPFAGTISLYRSAMFLLIAHTALSLCLSPVHISRSLGIILVLGAAFTAWSLLSAIAGVDSHYSRGKWMSEHLYVFLFFAAAALNPNRFCLPLILWAGILSALLIALGVFLDPFALDSVQIPPDSQLKLWKVAYLKGFSSDITWITSHMMLVHWIGMTAILLNTPRRPLFYGGLLSTFAGLWVVAQTFQVMAFFIVFVSTFVFLSVWIWKKYGRRGFWAIVIFLVAGAGCFAYRDLVMHPEKKTFRGILQLVRTGKTDNMHIQSRLNGIRWALEKCRERPFLGWGPGREILRKVEPQTFNINEAQIIDPSRHPPLGHLHDQYADLLIRVGIPGLAAYLLFLGAILARGFRGHPWREDWRKKPGAGFQLGALIAMSFELLRLLTETYPASSVGLQYWMVLAFAALPASAWDASGFTVFLRKTTRNTPELSR